MYLEVLKNKYFIKVTFYFLMVIINGLLYYELKGLDIVWWKQLIYSLVIGILFTGSVYLLYKMLEGLIRYSEIMKVLYTEKKYKDFIRVVIISSVTFLVLLFVQSYN